MPSPSPDWTTVTVAGKYKDYEGNPVAGRVIFTPTAERAVDADQLVMIVGRPISVAINESTGIASIALPATDDPDITPINFTYTVTEDFEFGQTYSIAVPMAKAGTGLDLATVAPQATSEGIPLYYMETLNARDLAQGYAQQAAGSVSLVAWAPNTVYVAGNIRQAPDGSGMRRNANGTSRATFDATEQAAWTAIVAVTGTMEQLAADARYLNMGETITDAELPGRLESAAVTVTNWNSATENGWYESAATATNAPNTTSTWVGMVIRHPTGSITQRIAARHFNGGATGTFTRNYNVDTATWSAWLQVYVTKTEMDARYVDVDEMGVANGVATLDADGNITPQQLPDRLWNQGLNVTDFNAATEAGWVKNSVGSAANAPGGSTGFFYGMVTASGARRLQTVWEITNSSADTKKWQRMSTDSGATWGAWYRLREAEAELDARYAPINLVEANLPTRLRGTTVTVASPDDALENGYYRVAGPNAALPDATNTYTILVENAGTTAYVTQTAYAHGIDGPADTRLWRRMRDNSVWGPWFRLRWSQDELDNRYSAGVPFSKIQSYSVAGTGMSTGLETTAGPYAKDGATFDTVLARYLSGGNGALLRAFGVDRNGLWTRSFWYKRRGASDTTFNVDVNDTYEQGTPSTFTATASWQRAVVRVEVTNNSGTMHFSDINFSSTSDIYIYDDSLTYGGQPAPPDSTWIDVGSGSGAPAFTNSWVNTGGAYAPAGFRKIGNRVHLKGVIKTGALGTSAFTLPIGFRPLTQLNLPTTANGGMGFLILNSSGNVTPNSGSNLDFSLDGISFMVD